MSHNCKAKVVTCMDFRFQKSLLGLLEKLGLIGNYDHFSIAGSQKAFIDEDTRAIAMKQVELSKKLHGMTDVYLIAHWDCGAYGGSQAFLSPKQELENYADDLEKARQIILEKFPELNVHKYLAKWDQDNYIVYDKM